MPGIPGGVEGGDHIGKRCAAAGVVVQIQGLDKFFVEVSGLTADAFLRAAGAEHPGAVGAPEQPKGSVGHAVFTDLGVLLMVVIGAASNVED